MEVAAIEIDPWGECSLKHRPVMNTRKGRVEKRGLEEMGGGENTAMSE